MERSAIGEHRSPPHLWADPINRDVFQTVPLNHAALALRNPTGVPSETNHRGVCLQVEWQLYSSPRFSSSPRHVDQLTDDQLKWMGETVATLDDVCRRVDPRGRGFLPDDPAGPNVLTGPRGDAGFGDRTPWRLTPAQWDTFSGVLGHVHVPQNDHFDPSSLDVRRVVEHAIAASPHKQTGRPAPMLRAGSTGEAVKRWQQVLNYTIDARLNVDGVFGPTTVQATKDLEAAMGLAPDGAVSVEQARLANKIVARQKAGTEKRPLPIPGARPDPARLPAAAVARGHIAAAIEHNQDLKARLAKALLILDEVPR